MRRVVLQMGVSLDGFVPKVVFSKTLTHADWPESRIASGNVYRPHESTR